MLGPLDAAWVAGLLEGEGCFSLSWGSRSYPRFTVKCNMTDRDVVEHLHSLCGGKLAGPYQRTSPAGKPAKDQWVWTIGRKDSMKELLLDLLPYMCTRRSAKILEMLQAMEDYPARTWNHGRTGYEHHSCLCDICRAAHNKHQRDMRRRRKERAA